MQTLVSVSLHLRELKLQGSSGLGLCYQTDSYEFAMFYCATCWRETDDHNGLWDAWILLKPVPYLRAQSLSAWKRHCGGFSGYGTQALGTWAQLLWCMGLVALWHIGSFQKAWNYVLYIGRQIPVHYAAREVTTTKTLYSICTALWKRSW